jgi:U2-associated protein SR140
MASTKKSVFEKQKEEAEAKKARDKAETDAVYEDFVKSFEQDTSYAAAPQQGRPQNAGFGSGPGFGKRHFTGSGLKSGPGSLGPAPVISKSGPGSLGPSFGGKRHFEDRQYQQGRDRTDSFRSDRRYQEHSAQEPSGKDRDDAEEKTARPTLHLSSLPPGTSPTVIKALFTSSPLTIEDVRLLATPGTERRSSSAIVTLAAETSASDIDNVVSSLQNSYLGFGFNLSLSRHLSSAALTGAGGLAGTASSTNTLPFGARPIVQQTSLARAPPPGQGRGFAPPSSYTSSTPYKRREQSQILVQPPSDLKQLRLIHKTIENLLTHGPEFEALLMSRPQVQRDQQWQWLWDPRSQGGVYYRWRLWRILNGSAKRKERPAYANKTEGEYLFEGQSVWVPAADQPKFEYTTTIEEFISDDDYDSSDEEAEFEEGDLSRRHNDHNATGLHQALTDTSDGHGYLNPLAKAKLIHLLTRLPEINTKLRRGDVMRLTAFAIEHAGAGANEVADLITRNVLQPLSLRSPTDPTTTHDPSTDKKDTSTAALVTLYTISDILSASASAGVRHAWRYRQLFETSLRKQKVFEKLGRLDRDLAWGKMKAEKWKRSVQNILQLWEGWCVFPQSSHEAMVEVFLNPPLSKEEQRRVEEDEKRKADEEAERRKAGNKWRSVDGEQQQDRKEDVKMGGMDVDGREMTSEDEDDPAAMDVDEETLVDPAVDGTSLADSSDEEAMDADEGVPPPPPPPPDLGETPHIPPTHPAAEPEHPKSSSPVKATIPKTTLISKGRQRPRATDMFADEEDESDGQ